ncbi:MAG: HAMP domain-containing histidine kinase [Chloroflexi bacterium]|nr:HAMP domain-containing histidine kinase [Chloroflexota bacterium]
MTDNQNEFIYKMSSYLGKGLADVNAKVNELARLEELEDIVQIPDSPLAHLNAALMPLIVQVSDFQDYAETITGRMELDLQEVDVHAMMEGVLMMADQLAEHKGDIEIEEDISENLPTIEGDPTRLSQALMRYIHNAVKFTDKGTVTIRVEKEADRILFEAHDTGIGIAEEDQEKVFEPFETILEDKKDPRLGFGLGLKIVEHIIELHDGETWFESKAGQGSSFFFTIPT